MGRAPCCDKANVKKGPWSPEEDAKLKSYIEKYGTGGNWIALPQKIGLKRCGKSCRLRWLNYLRPNIKHGGFSEEEDNIICSLFITIGSRWSIIAAQLPGRTDNDIKNYWNTKLKKKLLGKTRKEARHHNRQLGTVPVHEPKKSVGESFLVPNQPLSYHTPEQAVPTLPTPASDSFDYQDSIRKLLISRLNASINLDHYSQPTFSNPTTSHLGPSLLHDHTFSSMVQPIQIDAATSWSFPLELEESLYYDTMKIEGIDGMYNAGNSLGSFEGVSSSTGSIERWENINPLVYTPQIVIDYNHNGSMLLHEEQCDFLEQVQLGIQ